MTGKKTLWAAAWVWVALASQAGAAQEQPLAYRSSPDPRSVVGPVGDRPAETVEQAPQGVALPTFKTDKPVLFRWQATRPVGPRQTAEKVEVLFALDRSRTGGPCDLLYADSNGNGSLADETPLKPAEAQLQGDYEQARFNLVKVLLPGEDGPITYHLNVRYYAYNRQPRVYLSSACWYEGTITVGNKRMWCAVIDADLNGRFDDTSLRYDQADRLRIADKAGEPYKGFETDATVRPLAKHVEIDGKLYPVTVAPDGSSITLLDAVDIPTGTVRVGASVSQVNLFGPQGYFIRPVANGVATLPEGEYGLVLWGASRKDDKGAAWDLFAGPGDPDKAPKVSVSPGKEAALDIGEPVVSTVSHSQREREVYFNQELRGRHGEYVGILRNGERPDPPKLRIVNRSGTYDKTFPLKYG